MKNQTVFIVNSLLSISDATFQAKALIAPTGADSTLDPWPVTWTDSTQILTALDRNHKLA